ncbi:MAG: SIR2 family protein, partial [Bacteroidota bacterium]
MAAELYPADPALAPTDALRLAQEYEHTMTRNTLDALLARLIPDALYAPGPLHISLLELPWVDVLTTNYDTLLERAARRSGRRYSTVYRPADLARTAAPRIVKLHGSFPSHTPFVLTEEDFRRYPRTHAPFVSLAQTLLAEHAVLLVGFSGDDPNFLQWSGWVRDHLPASAPPLFLAGIHDLPPPKRTLLTSRGIAPIDLAPLFPRDTWNDVGERHAAALKWLLAALADARPPDPLDWPGPYARTDRKPKLPEHYPKLPPCPHPRAERRSPYRTGVPTRIRDTLAGRHTDRDIMQDALAWRRERERDPGWVVAPKEVRNRLWTSVREWNSPVFKALPDVESPDNLRVIYEHLWRLDRALLTPLGRELDAALAVLTRYNPAPHLITLPPPPEDPRVAGEATDEGNDVTDSTATVSEADIPATPHTEPDWPWEEITDLWFGLALIALRALRSHARNDVFDAWADTLAPLAATRPERAAELGYQRALHALDRLDTQGARGVLGSWPDTLEGSTFHELRRAAIIAELGDWRRATDLAEAVLARVLEAQASDDSVALRSQEGWARLFLENTREVAWRLDRAFEIRPQPEGWQRSLVPLGCDPKALLVPLAEAVLVDPPEPKSGSVTQPGFDPGRITHSYSITSGYQYEKHRPAFEYLRMREDAAVPLRTGHLRFDSRNVTHAGSWVRPFLLGTGYAVPLRAAAKEVELIFSRPRVAGLADDAAIYLMDWVLRGLRSAAMNIGASGLDSRSSVLQIQGLLPVLARLIVRADGDTREEAIGLVLALAHRREVQDISEAYRQLGTLLDRATTGLSEDRLRARISDLFALPLAGRELPTNGTIGQWFDPSERISPVELSPDDIRDDVVTALIVAVAGKAPLPNSVGKPAHERLVAKVFATLRLRFLYAHGALTPEQQNSFAHAFWGGLEDLEIPNLGPVSPDAILDVPPPPTGAPRLERVRKALTEATLPEAARGVIGASGAGDLVLAPLRQATLKDNAHVPERGERIDWTRQEAEALLDRIAIWWDADGEKYRTEKEREASGEAILVRASDLIEDQLNQIPLTLRDVILPRIEDPLSEVALKVILRSE